MVICRGGGLKIETPNGLRELKGIDTCMGAVALLYWKDGKAEMSFHIDCKPLLRPLSDLTKEIEHKGKKFVPTIEINKILNDGKYSRHFNNIEFNEYGSLRIDFGDHNSGYSINLETMPVIQKLYEWHFDVHGLIEQNLAIDLNTLKEAL